MKMNVIDNFEKIQSLLEFRDEDDFYFLQILKRKKENPEIGSNSYVLRTYCIRSVEQLESKKNEITDLCTTRNARAYINLNRRSFEKAAFHTMKKISDIIMNKDYKSVRNAYESVCGLYHNEPDKKWIVDLDHCTEDEPYVESMIDEIIKLGGSIYATIPTKNGIHLITAPFRLDHFHSISGSQIDVHKDNPTILFCLYK